MKASQFRLQEFQSHEDTTLEFSPFCNVIIGPSNVGKSSIIRALQLLFYNSIEGNSFVRTGSSFSTLSLTTNTGNIIKRKKGKKTNVYELNSLEYKDFGSTVPRKIVETLNTPEVIVDKDKTLVVHIASQLEGPYLFFTPDSFKAKAINRLSNSHVIDYVLRKLLGDTRTASSKSSQLEVEINTTKQTLEKYKIIDVIKKKVEDYVESKLKDIEDLEKMYAKLEDLNRKLITWEKDNQKLERQIYLLTTFDLENILRKIELYEIASELNKSYFISNKKCIDTDNKLSIYNRINLENILLKIDEYTKLQKVYNLVQTFNNDVKENNISLSFVEKNLEESKNLYIETLKINKVCPTCGQNIPEDIKI